MRLAPSPRVISAFTVSAACAALIAGAPASAATDAADPECIEVNNLVQHETLIPEEGSVTNPVPGTVFAHKGTLLNAAGKKVGISYGRGVAYREPGVPGTAQMVWGTAKFDDGAIFGVDHIDQTERDKFPGPTYTDDGVVGISGRYKGMLGARTFGVIDRSDPTHPVFSYSFKVCKVAAPTPTPTPTTS
jgi:hypothetical protein